MHWHFS
jgi:hypothetical protein